MWELSVRGGPSASSGTVPDTSRIFLSPAEIWLEKCYMNNSVANFVKLAL